MMVCLLVVAETILFINSIEVIRESRSIESSGGLSKLLSADTQANEKLSKNKSIQRLVGGHVKNVPQDNRDEVLNEESTGNGKSSKQKKESDDEDKKTLSQQVAEGKYGLIQKELFTDPPKRPGILSYKENEEVPKDTKSTLGGLDADDIWLAEDHLLVLKGGSFPEHNSKADTGANWPPIDNYRAPRRQVKIPSNPKVPPPFPIQLEDSGPIGFVGPNGTTYPIHEGPEADRYPIEGYVPGSGPFFPTPPNDFNYTGDTPFPLPPYGLTAPGNFSKGNGPPPPFPYGFPDVDPAKLPPYIASLPPGTAFLPALENRTDFYDEDDPSIYYPPPYSFYYPSDNSSSVPPGPLVPGIVLPPPPDFFAPLDEKKKEGNVAVQNGTQTTTTGTQPSPVIKVKPVPNAIPPTKHTPSKTVYITPPKPTYKPPPTMHPITKPIYVPDVQKQHVHIGFPSGTDNYDNNLQSITTPKPIVHTPTPPKIKYTTPYVPKVSNYYTSRRPDVSLSYLQHISKNPNLQQRPVIPTTTPVYDDYSENYYENNAVSQTPRPFPVYGPPERQRISYKVPGRTYVTTTAVPLKAYFTTGRDIESNSVTANPVNYYEHTNTPTRQPSKINPASYYFYEEDSIGNSLSSTTQNPHGNRYYTAEPNGRQYQNGHSGNQHNYYGITRNPEGITEFIPAQRQQYQLYQQNGRPESITNKIARLRQEIQSYLAPNRQVQYQTTPKPVYEYSFQAANYVPKNTNNQQTSSEDPFRPIVQYSAPYNQAKQVSHDGHLTTEQTSTEGYYQQTTVNRYEKPIPVTVQPSVHQSGRPNFQQPQYNYVRPTPNPINHAYYTKQDERLLDDITKQYFTVFGKKINEKGSVTPSLQDVEVTTAKTPVNKYVNNKEYYEVNNNRRPENPDIEIKYGDNSQTIHDKHIKEISLLSDTDVNYKLQEPTINPNSEFIPIVNPAYKQSPEVKIGHSLASDILVNYRHPKPTVHPDAEYIEPAYLNQHGKVNHSLHSDIDVNYKHPLPAINPDAEIIEHIYPYNHKTNPNAEELDATYNSREPGPDEIETFYHNYKQNGNGELVNNRKPQTEFVEVFYPTGYHQTNNNRNNLGQQLNQQLNQQHNAINYQNGHASPTAQVIRNSYVPKYPSTENVEIVKSINVLTKQIDPAEPVNSNFRQYETADGVRGQISHKPVNIPNRNSSPGEGRPGSFISYQLPGDGAHFYFLTPQAALRSTGRDDGYVYENTQRQRRSRLRQRAQRQRSQRAQQTEN